ncbi:MAG TPA: metallophosphoesterase [bacterium]|nr:metallophosphoesterase [bacterium]
MKRIAALLLALSVLLLLGAGSARHAADTFQFAVAGDFQPPRDDENYRPVSQRIIAAIAASEAEFVVLVGDLVTVPQPTPEKARAAWRRFDKLIAPLRAAHKRVYAVPGNHDVEHPALAIGFDERFGSRHRVFVEHDTVFLLLDSEADGQDYRRWDLGAAQWQWLRARPWRKLTDDPQPLLFAFLHRPVFRSEIMKLDPTGKYGQDKPELARELDEQNTAAVFSGHEHLFQRKVIRDISFFTTGGGGGHLLPTGYYHFLLVTVDPAKKEWRVDVKKVR